MAINKDEDVIDTADYKLDKRGRKVKAHRIVFNKGEDDGNKGIKEGSMKKSFNQFIEEHTLELSEEQLNELVAGLQEVLGKDAKAGEWISDFVHSDNPKFAGKSKEKRKQMALAAFYAKQRNEAYSGNPAREGMIAAGGGSPAERGMYAAKQEKKEDEKKKEVKEELKGDQHKLDKNKNGKLDAEDFKKLRKEDSELSEMSKEKLSGYVAKASAAKRNHQLNAAGAAEDEQHDIADDERKKAAKRASGINKAISRIRKEELGESKDQLSPGWMLKRDPELAKKLKDKIDLAKKRQASYGDKSAGISVKPVKEGWEDMLAASKKRSEQSKTSTATKHDIKKTSTGTVYTKQRDPDGMSKEFKRDPDQAKRGRGRPKKNSFSEAAEFLMSLDEETFDSMTEEGFDTFFESYEKLDELSKQTVRSYASKKQAELDDVPPMPFKKPGIPKAEREKAAKGMMGALARLSGVKPTSK